LKLDNESVIITAFKPGMDKDSLILRLFSVSGKDKLVRLEWSDPHPLDLWYSDLSEKSLSKADDKIKVPAGSIVTLREEMR